MAKNNKDTGKQSRKRKKRVYIGLDEKQHKTGPVAQIVANARNVNDLIVSEKNAENKRVVDERRVRQR